MTDKDHCLYCGNGEYEMVSKRIGTFTDGVVRTFIDDGTIRTVYEEYDLAGIICSKVRFNLSEFKMRYCPMCGREMNTPKYKDNINWEVIGKDTVFEFQNREDECK